MDREEPALPRMQLNFIEYLVLPLMHTLTKLLPDVRWLCEQLEENKKKWKALVDAT